MHLKNGFIKYGENNLLGYKLTYAGLLLPNHRLKQPSIFG